MMKRRILSLVALLAVLFPCCTPSSSSQPAIGSGEVAEEVDGTVRLVPQQNDPDHTGLSLLDIDFMNRGYYYARSAHVREDLDGYGGWGMSNNGPEVLLPGERSSGRGLIVEFRQDSAAVWQKNIQGIRLRVMNGSADTLFFSAQDSRLDMTLQAKDRDGAWRDIEYLPGSWCGNSYHTLYLAAGEYWEFISPRYHGEFPTRIRAKLLYRKSPEQREPDVAYSNEIDGSVNPGQFWRKAKYRPGGLMDPYND